MTSWAVTSSFGISMCSSLNVRTWVLNTLMSVTMPSWSPTAIQSPASNGRPKRMISPERTFASVLRAASPRTTPSTPAPRNRSEGASPKSPKMNSETTRNSENCVAWWASSRWWGEMRSFSDQYRISRFVTRVSM